MSANSVSNNTFAAYTAHIASTHDHLFNAGVFTDVIGSSNPVTAKLRAKGNKSVDGGRQVAIDIMYELVSNVDTYEDLDDLDLTRPDGMTQVFDKWSQMHGALILSGHEMRTNRGKAQAKSLVKARTKQLMNTLIERTNIMLWDIIPDDTTTGNDGKNIKSIPMIVPCNGKDIDLYGIDMSAKTYWQNKVKDYADSATKQAYTDKLRQLYLDCSKGVGGRPDMAVGDYQSYDLYIGAMDVKVRYTSIKESDIGFESVRLMGMDFFPDEHVPDTEAQVNWDSGSWANGSIYMLNTDFLKLLYLEGAEYSPDAPMKTPGKDALITNNFTEFQIVTDNRRKHGVAFDIPATTS